MSERALRAVRALLAPGWSQHGCATEEGRGCCHDDEGAWVFDLPGAILASTSDASVRLTTWLALDRATDGYAYTWSLQDGRTHAEVLDAVDRALLRAVREGAP